MDPLLALGAAAALLGAGVVAGLVIRVRSGRRKAPKTAGIAPSELGLVDWPAPVTLVQFSTEVCARCPGVRRALTQYTDQHAGIGYLDVDLTRDTELAQRFHVLSTPTVLVVDGDGVERARFSGAVTIDRVREAIAETKDHHDRVA